MTNNNIDEINKEFNINDFNNNKEDKNLQTDEETIKRSFTSLKIYSCIYHKKSL